MMWDNSNGYEERDRRYAPQVQMPTPTLPITIPGTATSAQFTPASFPQTTGQPGGFVPPSPSYNVTPSYQGSGFSVYQPQVQWPQMQQGYTQPGYGQPGQAMMIQQSYSDQYVRSRKHSHSRSRSHSHSRNPSSHSHHHSRHRTHSHSHPASQPQVIIAQPPSPNPILRPSRSYSQLPQVIQAPVHHSHHHRKSSSHSQTQPQVMFAQTPSPHPQHVIHQSHSFSNLPQAGAAQQFVHAANVLHSKTRVPPKKYTSAKLSKIGRLPSANAVFQYSKCTGRKKALCIGINYLGQQNELRGCINDARHVRDFLISDWGYRPGDIVILTDDSQNPRQQPTRENILAAMEWLVRNARPHDSLFFHYSGHGGQTKDLNGDEIDGYDEVIFPVDFKQTKHIIDDEMHAVMVKPLPPGCRLTALFDSCHSGTVLDLAYVYSSHGRLKGSQISSAVRDLLSTPADVISWSGCKDGQTSADTFHGGVAVGAMSWAFIQTLKQNPRQTYEELLRSLRRILAPKFDQTPQLGSSHRIDTSLSFIL